MLKEQERKRFAELASIWATHRIYTEQVVESLDSIEAFAAGRELDKAVLPMHLYMYWQPGEKGRKRVFVQDLGKCRAMYAE